MSRTQRVTEERQQPQRVQQNLMGVMVQLDPRAIQAVAVAAREQPEREEAQPEPQRARVERFQEVQAEQEEQQLGREIMARPTVAAVVVVDEVIL